MFLATTALTEFWDRDSDPLLMLGAWCLRDDQRSRWERLPHTVLPCPWDDRVRFYRACGELDRIYEAILPWLGQALDGLHGGPPKSTRYWRIVVGPWLFRYLHALFDRYTCVRDALATDGNLRTWTLSPALFTTPFDTRDYIGLVLDDHYNLQIVSEVVAALGMAHETRQVEHWPHLRSMRASPGTASTGIADAWLRRHPGDVALSDMSYRKSDLIRISVRSRGRVRPLRFPAVSPSLVSLNDTFRQTLRNPPMATEFGRVLGHSLPLAVPRLFIEDFARLRASVASGGSPPKIVISAAGWHDDEGFKCYAAECMEQGALLISAQHGGAYGTFRAQPQEDHEVAVADAFLTWGWKYTPKHVPLPSAHLARVVSSTRRRQSDAKGILLLTTSLPRYLYLFQSVPVAGQFDGYLDWQRRFVERLGHLTSETTVRLHPAEYGHGIQERLRRASSEIKFDAGRASEDAMASAALVVIDHPTTAMLESIAINRPTLLFWDPARWEARAEAQFVLDLLRGVGVLHYTPEGAAEAAGRVAHDAVAWWAQPQIQDARSVVVSMLADTGVDWRGALLRQLQTFEGRVSCGSAPTSNI